MAILRIRTADGTVQEVLAIRGENYVLTEADKQEIAGMIVEGNVDLSNYYDKEFLDPVITSTEERLTSLEEIAEQSVKDFGEIVPPLVDEVAALDERITTLETMPIYDGEVEDV